MRELLPPPHVERPHTAAANLQPTESTRSPRLRVLLVEDDPVLTARFLQILRAIDGAEVSCVARTEMEASEWLDANPHAWDVALVDVFLASGHGFKVLQHCAQRTPQQKVALMSTYDRNPMRQRALEAGADVFFDKATQLEELIDFCVAQRH